MATFKIRGFKVVVLEGYRVQVFRGRKLLNHFVITPPGYDLALGTWNDERTANVAVEAVEAHQ